MKIANFTSFIPNDIMSTLRGKMKSCLRTQNFLSRLLESTVKVPASPRAPMQERGAQVVLDESIEPE